MCAQAPNETTTRAFLRSSRAHSSCSVSRTAPFTNARSIPPSGKASTSARL
jgi:hypothetical protein